MMLSIQNATLLRQRIPLLTRIDFALLAGTCVALLGENGSGKSSLLHALADAEPGHLHWRGGDIAWGIPPTKDLTVRARYRSLSRQRIEAPLGLTVHDVLALASDHPGVAIQRWQLEDLAPRRTETLSGGQLQRLELARSWSQIQDQCGVWMLDEPFNMLDLRWQDGLGRLMSEHCQQGGSVLFSVHDLGRARQYAHRVLMLGEGCQLAFGGLDLLERHDLLARVYGLPVHHEAWL